MSKDTGGQAFARPISNGTIFVEGQEQNIKFAPQSGMTLRDYFIAHCPDIPSWYRSKINPTRHDFDSEVDYERVFFSWRTYYADAMITERNKP